MSEKDCLFCKFITGELSTEKVYEDEYVLAFKDIYPQAKEHYLFVPKQHLQDSFELMHDLKLTGQVMNAIKQFVKESGLDKSGYRIVTNNGPQAGQTIFHCHFHLLAGEQLKGFGS